MARQVTQYDLLISCPGDIKEEIPLINKAVNEFNTLFSDALGISIRTKHWSKNAYAQSGNKPQALLNEQFVSDCDAAVALFWTRFGTPTDEYGSGTEEEIEIMLGSGKQVFMYFSDKPSPPSQHNAAEYARVKAFREKYKGRGLYFNYTTDDEFYKLFFAHLTQHFIAEKRVAEVRAERVPELLLRGIDCEGKLSEAAVFQPLKMNTERTLQGEIEEIKELIRQISDIHVVMLSGTLGSIYRGLNSPVEVSPEIVDAINEAAKSLGISLPEDFFCVGNLTKDYLSAPSLFSGPQYNGSPDEKLKHSLIQKLYRKINEACSWGSAEDGFKNIMCVKLALANDGTAADDEIEITLQIPQSQYLTLDELPALDENTMKYLTRDCDLYDLLGIHGTAEYTDYDSSTARQPQTAPPRSVPVLPCDIDYAEDYREELEDIFCYEVYPDGDDYVIKLSIDHLKHHTVVAFPAALLLKENPGVINFTITSKNAADVISSQICVQQGD